MKLLLVHNYYQQPGGEDLAVELQRRLFEERGHQVVTYTLHNDTVKTMSGPVAALRAVWNPASYREISVLLRREKPDLVHCHNTFPLVSPAVYYAAARAGVPVVQTLHNFRLLCVNAFLYRQDRICEECLGRAPWAGVRHACYRASRPASAAVAAMLSVHRLAGTYTRRITRYIALTPFARQKFIQGGLPAGRVDISPNFLISDQSIGEGRGGFALFAGRLSAEKGLPVLLAAWRRLGSTLPLKIVGDGPLVSAVTRAALEQPGIQYLGYRSHAEVMQLASKAACLILPSTCYENLPTVLIEAFSVGTPVIASRLGALPDLITHAQNGWLFDPGSSESLASAVQQFAACTSSMSAVRQAARAAYEQQFTPEHAYARLTAIYQRALAQEASA